MDKNNHTYLYVYIGIYQRRQWHPTPVLLPGKSMDRGAWWAAVHGVAKSRTRLSDFPFTFHFHALEKEMATHSCSCLENPRDGEPGGLPSVGSQSWPRLRRLGSSSRHYSHEISVISTHFTGEETTTSWLIDSSN